jgi:hypothetical protein
LSLAKTVDECGVDFGWEIFAKDAIRRGRGSASLAEALAGLGEPAGVLDLEGTAGAENYLHLRVGRWGDSSTYVSGTDLNWVAGSAERVRATLRALPASWWWRWNGTPLLVVATLAYVAVFTSIGTTTGEQLRDPSYVLPRLAVALFLAVWGWWWGIRTWFGAPRLRLHRTMGGPPWYQHPLVESAKTLALFIGAAWALLQLLRTFSGG